MPISQNTYTVPNNFVQQYDLGQKKIRADLVDENFTDAAGAINTLLTDDANTVHLTGAETVTGAKTFTAAITASGGVTGNVTGNLTGNVTGDITGNCSGSSGSCTGNSATATKLQTARTINGVSFDGSENITIPSYEGQVTFKDSRNTTGNWTIAGLTTNKPLYLCINSSSSGIFQFRVTSGSDDAVVGNATYSYVMGYNGSSYATPPSTVVIPTATSVTIDVKTVSNGVVCRAYQ